MKQFTSLLALSLAGLLVAAPAFGAGTLLYQQDFEQPVGTAATDGLVGLTHIAGPPNFGDTGLIVGTVIDSGNSLGKAGGVDDMYVAPITPYTLDASNNEFFKLSAVLHVGHDTQGLAYFVAGRSTGHFWAEGTRVGFDHLGGTEVVCLDQSGGTTCDGGTVSQTALSVGSGGTLRVTLEIHPTTTSLHYSLVGGASGTFGPFAGGQSTIDRVGMKLHTDHDDVGFDSVSLTVIPEPASLALLGLGGIALLLRRRWA